MVLGVFAYPIDSRVMQGKSSIGAGWAVAIAVVAIGVAFVIYRYLRAS